MARFAPEQRNTLQVSASARQVLTPPPAPRLTFLANAPSLPQFEMLPPSVLDFELLPPSVLDLKDLCVETALLQVPAAPRLRPHPEPFFDDDMSDLELPDSAMDLDAEFGFEGDSELQDDVDEDCDVFGLQDVFQLVEHAKKCDSEQLKMQKDKGTWSLRRSTLNKLPKASLLQGMSCEEDFRAVVCKNFKNRSASLCGSDVSTALGSPTPSFTLTRGLSSRTIDFDNTGAELK